MDGKVNCTTHLAKVGGERNVRLFFSVFPRQKKSSKRTSPGSSLMCEWETRGVGWKIFLGVGEKCVRVMQLLPTPTPTPTP